jgi:tetratricopeptide (TPR) repeat protein
MNFELLIETEPKQAIARLRVMDEHGAQLAASLVEFQKQSAARWEGLFDTRSHVQRYAGVLRETPKATPKTEEEILGEIGLFLGKTVFGPDIMGHLSGDHHRTLLIRLPDTANDPLAAALARVPWEMARAHADEPPLFQRNLVVRAVAQNCAPLALEANALGALRILLVFAEAPGSRPLAMRLERENLLRLFFDEVLPHRSVEVDVLCHGVTRLRLTDQIMSRGGYQIIHWSGHGHQNLLELYGQEGRPDYLSGADLVKLTRAAGGFIPQLIFLSTCLSGTFINVKSWEHFQAAMAGQSLGGKQSGDRKLPEILATRTGYTGTALELLKAGVAAAIAMRYEVGDDYARDLAEQFYKHLLADPAHHTVETALSLARGELARADDRTCGYQPVDHVTPLLFGQGQIAFRPEAKRSDQLVRRRPQPQPLLPGGSTELETPAVFVGRGAELARLAGHWLPRNQAAVALVQGLAGLGKSAFTAEAIHLWHRRFDLIFAFQSKPLPLAVEDFYRLVDLKLRLNSAVYPNTCERSPNAAVHLPATTLLTGAPRLDQMLVNLLEALYNENILLVLDNFDSNLESVAGPQGYRCQDPAWDRLLAELAARLPPAGSRVIITSRHRLVTLADPHKVLWLPLGPLSMGDSALYVLSHDSLRRLYYRDAAGQALAMRLLQVCRGHPLILDRLASLANHPMALTQALDRLQSSRGWQTLPDLFAGANSETERERERAYLEDVAIGAVDVLIQRAGPAARRLLWLITLANEPVPPELAESIWTGRSIEDEELEKFRPLLARKNLLPDEVKGRLDMILSTEAGQKLLRRLEDLKPVAALPPVRLLLEELHSAGLLSHDTAGSPESHPYALHELVRERMANWIETHPDETGGRSPEKVWLNYGERYAAAFEQQLASGQPGAMDRATEAGRRALTYLARAHAFDELAALANMMVSSTSDPSALRSAIQDLRAVVSQVPRGPSRWTTMASLADALRQADRPAESLPLYESAAAEAESAADWPALAVIFHCWATALLMNGQIIQAKALQQRSAEAAERAGTSRVNVLMTELEMLRTEETLGGAATVLPEINRRLDEVRGWWKRHQAGEFVAEAPNPVMLSRTLLSGLNIAVIANGALARWQTSLDLVAESEHLAQSLGETELELAQIRFNRLGPLQGLGRLKEAQECVESCLATFRAKGRMTDQVRALSALAMIWYKRGEVDQAARLVHHVLSLSNRLPDPADRAMCHANLANCLEEAGHPLPASRHQIAAAAYCVVSGYGRHLTTWRHNIASAMCRAALRHQQYQPPRVSDLLVDPEFDALRQFLANRSADPAKLQSAIDQLVEQARQQALSAVGSAQLPPEVQAISQRLQEAASAHHPLESILTELRSAMLKALPGTEAQTDAAIAQVRQQLEAEHRQADSKDAR